MTKDKNIIDLQKVIDEKKTPPEGYTQSDVNAKILETIKDLMRTNDKLISKNRELVERSNELSESVELANETIYQNTVRIEQLEEKNK